MPIKWQRYLTIDSIYDLTKAISTVTDVWARVRLLVLLISVWQYIDTIDTPSSINGFNVTFFVAGHVPAQSCRLLCIVPFVAPPTEALRYTATETVRE